MMDFKSFIRSLRGGIDGEAIFDDGLIKDGSRFKGAMPLLRDAVSEEVKPLRLDEEFDDSDLRLFIQKFIPDKCEAKCC